MTRILITGAGAVLGHKFQSLKHTRLIPDLFIGFADPSPCCGPPQLMLLFNSDGRMMITSVLYQYPQGECL